MINLSDEKRFKLNQFFSSFTKINKRILLLDYDGTLSPFTPDRDNAAPYPATPSYLEKIISIPQNRVIIISGRTIKDIKKLMPLKNNVEIWGCHGLERITTNGEYFIKDIPEKTKKYLELVIDWSRQNWIENMTEIKPSSVALHLRGLTNDISMELKNKAENMLKPQLNESYILFTYFDGGIEIRVPGINKGQAVMEILENYNNDFVCAYLGDDLTDEDAFKALKDRGLSVLVRNEYRETLADLWLTPPGELYCFLEQWMNN
jgi:trehalose-phosphatase